LPSSCCLFLSLVLLSRQSDRDNPNELLLVPEIQLASSTHAFALSAAITRVLFESSLIRGQSKSRVLQRARRDLSNFTSLGAYNKIGDSARSDDKMNDTDESPVNGRSTKMRPDVLARKRQLSFALRESRKNTIAVESLADRIDRAIRSPRNGD
jgi:hypothetical protein